MKITVLMPFDDISREKMTRAFPEHDIVFACDDGIGTGGRQKLNADKYGADLLSADIVVGNPPADMLPQMTNMKLIQLNSAGTEPYSRPGVLRDGVKLCNATGAYGKAISEYMLACTLSLIKRLHQYRSNMSAHLWKDMGLVRSISDMTVMSVGLGNIGMDYARLCKALGAHVIGIRRSGTERPEFVGELYHTDQLDSVLPRADVVALSLPNTPATVGLMNEKRLSLMKEGSYLLNVGRGNAVELPALVKALESGHLAGAAIDVTDPEPLPADSNAWDVSNLIITPHTSGGYHLRATYDTIVDIAIRNITEFIAGRELPTEVDLSTGYRRTQK